MKKLLIFLCFLVLAPANLLANVVMRSFCCNRKSKSQDCCKTVKKYCKWAQISKSWLWIGSAVPLRKPSDVMVLSK